MSASATVCPWCKGVASSKRPHYSCNDSLDELAKSAAKLRQQLRDKPSSGSSTDLVLISRDRSDDVKRSEMFLVQASDVPGGIESLHRRTEETTVAVHILSALAYIEPDRHSRWKRPLQPREGERIVECLFY